MLSICDHLTLAWQELDPVPTTSRQWNCVFGRYAYAYAKTTAIAASELIL